MYISRSLYIYEVSILLLFKLDGELEHHRGRIVYCNRAKVDTRIWPYVSHASQNDCPNLFYAYLYERGKMELIFSQHILTLGLFWHIKY